MYRIRRLSWFPGMFYQVEKRKANSWDWEYKEMFILFRSAKKYVDREKGSKPKKKARVVWTG